METSEPESRIIYAKINPDTGNQGEVGEEEVLGYLEVQPSDNNTYYLPSQQIEINGEHVILAQQEETGDIIVVVRTEQDGEEGTILMEGIEESKSSNDGEVRDSNITEMIICEESLQQLESKGSSNQKLLQLACLANQIDISDFSPSSSSKIDEVIVVEDSDITIIESSPKSPKENTTEVTLSKDEEMTQIDNGNIFDKLVSNKGWIGKESSETLDDSEINLSGKDSNELSIINISNGHSPERNEHSGEDNEILTSENDKSKEVEYNIQHVSFSDESIELSSDKIDACMSDLQDVDESALNSVSPKEKEPEIEDEKEKTPTKKILVKRKQTPKSALKSQQNISKASSKKKSPPDTTPTSKKKKTLDKFDLIKMKKPPSLKNPLFRLIKPKSIINAAKLSSASPKIKRTVTKTSTPISNKSSPVKDQSVYLFEPPSSPPLKKYKSTKSSSPHSVQLHTSCDIRIRIQKAAPQSHTQSYKCANCPFTTTRINNMMHHYKKECTKNKNEFSYNTEQAESSSTTALVPEKPPNSKPEAIVKGAHNRVENPLESSDSEEEFNESKTKQSLGFKKHDVVWIEWRDLHRPALIIDVLLKEKKAMVMYIDSFVPNSEVKISFKRMSSFDNAERNKKFLSEGKTTAFGTSVFKAVQKAEDYLRKRCLGYAIKPLQFFSAPIVSQDSILNEETSDLSDNEAQLDRENVKAGIDRLFKLIKNEKVKNHLLGVFSTTINSDRHLKFHSRSSEEKEQLKQTSWFGPVADLTQQEQIYDYCLALFKQSCKYGKNYDLVAYMFEVWVPEAIIKAISLINKISFEEAEKFFSDLNNKGIYITPAKTPLETSATPPVSTSDTTNELLSLEF